MLVHAVPPISICSLFGGEFIAEIYELIADVFGFKRHFTTPYHPQCNGSVERYNRNLKGSLRIAAKIRKWNYTKRNNWDALLTMFDAGENNSICRATGLRPQELVYGQRMRFPSDILAKLNDGTFKSDPSKKQSYHEFQVWLRTSLQTMKHAAKLKQEKYQRAMKTQFDREHQRHQFREGDMVKVFVKDTRQDKKTLEPYWDAPYKVTEVRDPTLPIFKVKKMGNAKAKPFTVNCNRVEWYNRQGQATKQQLRKTRTHIHYSRNGGDV